MAPANKRIRAVLIDLDGTVFFKGVPIPGARESLAELKGMGMHLSFLTNIDSRTSETIHDELARIGLAIDVGEIFSATSAALQFLAENRGKRCYSLVSSELARAFDTYDADEGTPDFVIVGDPRESLSYEKLNLAFQHIMAGAEIVALQKGRYYIRSNGYNLDTGAFVSLLEYASGKTARVLGKPSREFFNRALKHVGCRADEVAVVGDDVDADIAGAKGIGALAVLVRTGKYDEARLMRSSAKPDLVVDSIADVPSVIREM